MDYTTALKWLKDRNIILEEGFCETLYEMALTYKKNITVI